MGLYSKCISFTGQTLVVCPTTRLRLKVSCLFTTLQLGGHLNKGYCCGSIFSLSSPRLGLKVVVNVFGSYVLKP